MRKMPSVLTPSGLVLILVGGLRGGDATSGAFAFVAFLILGVVTYPPAEARRGAQAAMVLGSALCLLALTLVLEEFRVGLVKARAMDDVLVLAGSALVVVDAAGQLLGGRHTERAAARWGGRTDRAQPVRPLS